MNSPFNPAYTKKLKRLFNQRAEYQRLAILGGVILFIFIIWFELICNPALTKSAELATKIAVASKNITTIKQDYQNYQELDQTTSHTVLKQQAAKLEQELAELKKHPLLEKEIVKSPEEMQRLMQKLTETSPDISLDKIEQLKEAPATQIEQGKTPKFPYKKILISFHGGYFATLEYLSYIEDLPWNTSLESIEYHVEKYPNAAVNLTIRVPSK